MPENDASKRRSSEPPEVEAAQISSRSDRSTALIVALCTLLGTVITAGVSLWISSSSGNADDPQALPETTGPATSSVPTTTTEPTPSLTTTPGEENGGEAEAPVVVEARYKGLTLILEPPELGYD